MASNKSPSYERVALLIDAENIRPEHLDRLLETARGLGRITVRRAYADWSRRYVQVWREALSQAAIRPVHHFAIANLKNGVDVAMTVDVLRLLAEEQPEAVVMASGDADMAALVMALREAGVYVYGFGTDQTNASFRACFDYFESLGPDTHPAGEARRAEAEVPRQEGKSSGGRSRIAAGGSRRLSRGPARKSAKAGPSSEQEADAQAVPQEAEPATVSAPEPAPAAVPEPQPASAEPAKPAEQVEPELAENEHLLQAVEAVAGKDGWAY
ncbi:MAG: NYN domain-containing protein, partial [Candidatus Competibacteraceae bacterium]|nr:NYN domain-containing protein [Candidatus Competibacteraceae bacterium]